MVKYVKEFEHPEGFGFSGSAGKVMVKAYARGGPTRAPKTGKVPAVVPGAPSAPPPAAPPAPTGPMQPPPGALSAVVGRFAKK